MRFRRSRGDEPEEDVIIDLRERLAPYGDGDPSPEEPVGPVAHETTSSKRSPRAKSPRPRHLAR